MSRMIRVGQVFYAAFVGLSLVGVLGCSAAKSIVNNNLPSVSNALHLDGQSMSGTVNGSRAVLSGNATRSFTFANTTVPQGGSLKRIRHTQRLSKTVTITVPSGSLPPPQFQVRNLTLAASIQDTETTDVGTLPRTYSASMSIAGPITFTRVGFTNSYTASDDPAFSTIDVTSDQLDIFRGIVSAGSTPNNGSVRLSFDVDDTQLPRGSTITFTTANSTATISI